MQEAGKERDHPLERDHPFIGSPHTRQLGLAGSSAQGWESSAFKGCWRALSGPRLLSADPEGRRWNVVSAKRMPVGKWREKPVPRGRGAHSMI